jgi:hypothetical protein
MKTVNYNNEPNDFGYVHDSAITCHPTAENILFEFDINEFEPHELIKAAVAHFKTEIEQWLIKTYDADVLTGEGYNGIEDWFGMGSYAIMELGLKFDFHYSDASTTMLIYR